MPAATIAQYAMFVACACYSVAGTAYFYDGKFWMAITVWLYAMTVITVWLAGTK